MAKHTYHFKHDFNAHNDEKIIDLRMDHGFEGYGLFWYLIELLASADGYKLERNYRRIAFSCGSKEETIRSVIEDYDLFFTCIDGFFWSDSLIERMRKLDEIKQKRAEAGAKGGKVGGLLREKGVDNEGREQLYVLECFAGDERFIKVGITSSLISRRFSGKMPYQYKVLFQVVADGDELTNMEVMGFESEFGEMCCGYSYTPEKSFGGMTECFTLACLPEIDEKMKELSKKYTSQIHRTSIAQASLSIAKQSKVKESKVKESKEEERKEINTHLENALSLWDSISWTKPRVFRSAKTKASVSKKVEARVKSFGPELLEQWHEALEPLKRANSESWFTFEWAFSSDSNMEKLLNGNYSYLQAKMVRRQEPKDLGEATMMYYDGVWDIANGCFIKGKEFVEEVV